MKGNLTHWQIKLETDTDQKIFSGVNKQANKQNRQLREQKYKAGEERRLSTVCDVRAKHCGFDQRCPDQPRLNNTFLMDK